VSKKVKNLKHGALFPAYLRGKAYSRMKHRDDRDECRLHALGQFMDKVFGDRHHHDSEALEPNMSVHAVTDQESSPSIKSTVRKDGM
jgi:hypothetical protein